MRTYRPQVYPRGWQQRRRAMRGEAVVDEAAVRVRAHAQVEPQVVVRQPPQHSPRHVLLNERRHVLHGVEWFP